MQRTRIIWTHELVSTRKSDYDVFLGFSVQSSGVSPSECTKDSPRVSCSLQRHMFAMPARNGVHMLRRSRARPTTTQRLVLSKEKR